MAVLLHQRSNFVAFLWSASGRHELASVAFDAPPWKPKSLASKNNPHYILDFPDCRGIVKADVVAALCAEVVWLRLAVRLSGLDSIAWQDFGLFHAIIDEVRCDGKTWEAHFISGSGPAFPPMSFTLEQLDKAVSFEESDDPLIYADWCADNGWPERERQLREAALSAAAE